MAIASLSKFTVPLASDQSASSQGMLMPKLAYRFRLSFENFGVSTPTTELTKQVMDFTRPNVTFENIDLPVYNSTVKIASKPKWDDIKLKLRDDMTNLVTNKVGEQMQKQFDFFEQSSAASGLDYKFTTYIELLDGGNGATTVNVLEAWELYGCFLSTVDWGDMAYNSNDPVQIALTIKFDNAIQTGGTVSATLPNTGARTPGGTAIGGTSAGG